MASTQHTSTIYHDERGSLLVETALLLPVFLMFVFGIITFAAMMCSYGNLCFATRAATRYACLHSSTSYSPATTASINSVISPFWFSYPSNTYATTVTYGSSGNVVGGTATVSVAVTYDLSMPFYSAPGMTLTHQSSGVIIY